MDHPVYFPKSTPALVCLTQDLNHINLYTGLQCHQITNTRKSPNYRPVQLCAYKWLVTLWTGGQRTLWSVNRVEGDKKSSTYRVRHKT